MAGEFDLALDKLRGIGGVAGDVLTLVHLGVPQPKERARLNRATGGIYTPTKTKDAEEALSWAFHIARRGKQFPDTVAIVAIFYVPTLQPKDADNCMKLVMDAATKAKLWKDDRLVTAQAGFFELDARRPRTVVAVCPYLCSLSRTPLLTAAASERTVS